jgi:UDP-glucose 4-epimerase
MEIPKANGEEEIATDVAKVSHINAILLRYFNPIEHILPLKWRITYWVPQNLVPFMQTGFDYEESSLFTAITQRLTEQR